MVKAKDHRKTPSKNKITRSEKEKDQDFELSCHLLEQNKNWQDIADHINAIRPYSLTKRSYQRAYKRRLENEALQKAGPSELDKVLTQLDFVMELAMTQFHASMGEIYVQQDKGVVIGDQFTAIERVVKTSNGLGDSKFLDIYLKALEKKANLLNLEKTSNSMNFIQILNQIKIDDSSAPRSLPITSEKELYKSMYKDYEEVNH